MDSSKKSRRKKQQASQAMQNSDSSLEVERILAPYELMRLAQHFPGLYESPYCKGIEPTTLRTGNLFSSSVFPTSYDSTGSGPSVFIGSQTYTVIMQVPALSLYKPSGTGTASGVFMSVTNDYGIPYQFLTLGGTNSLSMASLFGDDGTGVADNVFFWAQRLEISLSAPAASRSGKAYLATLPISSLMIDASSTSALGSFTVNQLVQNAHTCLDISTLDEPIVLSNFVMNTNLPFSTYNVTATTLSNQFQGEIVQVCVIDSAYRNITTGALSNYTLSFETSANIAYFPKASSIIAQSLSGEAAVKQKMASTQNSAYTKVEEKKSSEAASNNGVPSALIPYRNRNGVMNLRMPLTQSVASPLVAPPHPMVMAPSWLYKLSPSLSKGWDWLENAYEKVKPWAHTALKIGEMIAPLLADREPLCDTATYRSHLTFSLLQIKPLAVYSTVVELLEKDVKWLNTQDRLFLLSDLPSQRQPQTNGALNHQVTPDEVNVAHLSKVQLGYLYKIAQSDQRFADIEKNPGPIVNNVMQEQICEAQDEQDPN